jgi:hypothetical protein
VPVEQSSLHYWQPWQAHTGPKFAFGIQNFLRVRLNKCRKLAEAIQNDLNPMQLGEEKPFKGNVKCLNWAAVGPMTMRVTNHHFGVVK